MLGIKAQLIGTHAAERAAEWELRKYTSQPHPERRLLGMRCTLCSSMDTNTRNWSDSFSATSLRPWSLPPLQAFISQSTVVFPYTSPHLSFLSYLPSLLSPVREGKLDELHWAHSRKNLKHLYIALHLDCPLYTQIKINGILFCW